MYTLAMQKRLKISIINLQNILIRQNTYMTQNDGLCKDLLMPEMMLNSSGRSPSNCHRLEDELVLLSL